MTPHSKRETMEERFDKWIALFGYSLDEDTIHVVRKMLNSELKLLLTDIVGKKRMDYISDLEDTFEIVTVEDIKSVAHEHGLHLD